ncbi:MAG TPA: DinB family protein [Thermoanaerobaculia bacterium]|nr:DinB family protein [Thermoanaerobaculia bacterium]
MNAADVRTLLAYNRWANERILEGVRTLDPAELTRDLQTSFQSILGTLGHLVVVEWIWLQRWRGESPRRPPNVSQYETLAELEQEWRDVQADQQRFADEVTDAQLEQRIAYQNYREETWEYALGHMIQHLVNHSTFHRGQLVTLLRQLGRAPQATDFVEYLDEGI